MKRDELVAKALETEFRKTLSRVVTLKEFTQELGKLLGLMGYKNFSLFHWRSIDYYLKTPPRLLISTNTTQAVKKAISYFHNVAAMRPSDELLDIYYEETDSLLDAPNTAVRRGCCILSTPTANYGYALRKGKHISSGQQVLSVVSETLSANQFSVKTKNNRLALDSLNRIIQEMGIKRFPELFSSDVNKEKITKKNKLFCLLNIIAHNDVTLSQAARMMGISVYTANKKIAKIKAELGVSTLPTAVLYASNKDLIDRVL